jgi:predicted exporter
MDIVFKELFGTDIGLLSLFTILFIIGMGIWFSVWFKRRMNSRDE